MEKNDLRVIKTVKVLNTAMFSLLEHYNFGKITVSTICDEAQISRAAFYSHFADKYDFLKSWLGNIKSEVVKDGSVYEKSEEILNDFIYKNKLIFKNLIYDADSETLEILAELILSVLYKTDEDKSTESDSKHIVLSTFFSGGMLSYVSWQIRHKFPSSVTLINSHLYEIIKIFRELESD